MKTKRVIGQVDTAVVIGLDSIGRQVALLLASLGVQRLMLIDARRVPARQAARQGYFTEDVGRWKTHVTAESCHRLNPGLEVQTATRLDLRRLGADHAVLMCRQYTAAWHAELRDVAHKVAFFGYVHVTGRALTILTAAGPNGAWARLRTSPQSSAPPHVAALAASLLVNEFMRFLNGLRPRPVIRLQLDSLRLVTS